MGVEYSGTHAKPRLELGVAVMEYVEQAKEFIGSFCLPIFTKATTSPVTRAKKINVPKVISSLLSII